MDIVVTIKDKDELVRIAQDLIACLELLRLDISGMADTMENVRDQLEEYNDGRQKD